MGDVGVINHTIYVSNLNEKIKKPLLKKSLHRYELENGCAALICKGWRREATICDMLVLLCSTASRIQQQQQSVVAPSVQPWHNASPCKFHVVAAYLLLMSAVSGHCSNCRRNLCAVQSNDLYS